MLNRYLKNLNKIEFVLTDACTGKCKHCSGGDHPSRGEHIDADIAKDALRKVASEYAVKTAMVFGGEPLLYPDAVCEIIRVARDMNIAKRQVITNGFFSKDEGRIRAVAEKLAEAGVNDLLISVDAFHQETIPLDIVKTFAKEAKNAKISTRLQPAWLVSPNDENSYNLKTREILSELYDLKIPVGDGNVIFPEGNALKYLGEYFGKDTPKNPYIDDPCDVKCLSFSANGDVLDSNVYKKDVMEIIRAYNPKKD